MANRFRTRTYVIPHLRVGCIVVGLVAMTGMSARCSDSPATSPSDLFRVTAVFPTSGPADSSIELSIAGLGFEPGATVTVGGAATEVRVISSSLIKAITPIYPPGAVDVVVTNPSGRTDRLARAYTYVVFAVNEVRPQRGLPGDLLRILGAAFSANAVLTIGGVTAGVIQPTSTQLMILAPVLPPGIVEISVTNPDGQRRTLPQGFTYDAVAISASTSSVRVGSPLSVTWETPSPRPGTDWVGLFGVGVPNGDTYVWWQYTRGQMRDTLTLPAPNQPGNYEFRYFADDGYIDAVRSAVVTVIPAAGDAPADASSWTAATRFPAFPSIRPGRGRGRS